MIRGPLDTPRARDAKGQAQDDWIAYGGGLGEVVWPPAPSPPLAAPPLPAAAAAAASTASVPNSVVGPSPPRGGDAEEDDDEEEARKAKQRLLDRARRKRMNESMEELTALVQAAESGDGGEPSAKRPKIDKAALLASSVELVQRLQRENAALREKARAGEALRRENEQLRQALGREQRQVAALMASAAPTRADRELGGMEMALAQLGGDIHIADFEREFTRRARVISQAFGDTPIVMVIKDVRHNTLSVSNSFQTISGFRAEDVLGTSYPVVFATELTPKLPRRAKLQATDMVHGTWTLMVEETQALLSGEKTVASAVVEFPRAHPVRVLRNPESDPRCGISIVQGEDQDGAYMSWLETMEVLAVHWLVRGAAGEPRYFACLGVPLQRRAQSDVGLGLDAAAPNLGRLARAPVIGDGGTGAFVFHGLSLRELADAPSTPSSR